jgi:hypothetical protein
MAQQQAAQQVAKLLSRVGRWSIVLGIGGSALQASLYTGGGFARTWARYEARLVARTRRPCFGTC